MKIRSKKTIKEGKIFLETKSPNQNSLALLADKTIDYIKVFRINFLTCPKKVYQDGIPTFVAFCYFKLYRQNSKFV